MTFCLRLEGTYLLENVESLFARNDMNTTPIEPWRSLILTNVAHAVTLTLGNGEGQGHMNIRIQSDCLSHFYLFMISGFFY